MGNSKHLTDRPAAAQLAYRERVEAFVACREAGLTLTRASLKYGISSESVVRVAAEATTYVTEALTIVEDEYRPALHCQEGCDYCCRKPGVLVMIPELLRMLEHVRSTFSTDAIEGLRARARRYVAQVADRRGQQVSGESVPCPFLVDRRCSVYEARPLVCRGYNSTDVDACRRAHTDARARVPIFAFLKDVTDGTTVGISHGLRRAGWDDAMVDLGLATGIALEADEGFAQAVVAGAPLLAPARNSSWVGKLWAEVRKVGRRVRRAV